MKKYNPYFTYPEIQRWDKLTNDTNDWNSGVIELAKEEKWVAPFYDLEKMKHTVTGRDMAEAAFLELSFNTVRDPGLSAFWEQRGLEYTVHDKNGETWLSFLPKCARENGKRYPVMLCFRPAADQWGVFAQGFYYHLLEIAAQDELAVLIFSTEDRDRNELFLEILEEACGLYPLDRSRVYVTGHSHYGEFALHFMRNHPERIAGVAQQGDCPGMHVISTAPEDLERMHGLDMPLIDVAGWAEMTRIFPVNTDAPELESFGGSRYATRFPATAEERIKTWQNRLYASRCRVLSREEILAARGGTRAEQMLGFPCDHSETLFVDGLEVYVGDIRNVDGKLHLRMAVVENLTHTTCKFMHTLSWSFLRRFARDQETGEVIELYQ